MSRDDRSECCEKECRCGVRFRDAWNSGSIYYPSDAVPFNGSSYVALYPNQNSPPPNSNWALIASKGDPGPAGQPGPAGPPGQPGQSGEAAATELFVAKANADSPFEGVICVPHGALVASLPLAAGAFLLSGMLEIKCTDGDKQTCTIEVKSDDQLIYSFDQQMGSFGSDTDRCLLPISIPLTLRAPTTVTVIGHGFNIVIGLILSALKIGTLHGDSKSA